MLVAFSVAPSGGPTGDSVAEAVGEFGPRVSLVLKADIRPGHTGELEGKLQRLAQHL